MWKHKIPETSVSWELVHVLYPSYTGESAVPSFVYDHSVHVFDQVHPQQCQLLSLPWRQVQHLQRPQLLPCLSSRPTRSCSSPTCRRRPTRWCCPCCSTSTYASLFIITSSGFFFFFFFFFSKPVYFYAFGVKCTLWRPLLRLSCQILRCLAAISDFRLSTIDLCKKFICEDGDRVMHMKNAFGWLPVMQDPINFKLTRTLAQTWIFSLASAFSVVDVPFLCEFSTMSSKRNHETGSCNRETGVWKKKRCHQVGSINSTAFRT